MPTPTVNQEPKQFPAPLTVAELLVQLQLDPRRVAVEVNRAVVPRAHHDEHALVEGDEDKVVTLVGGGAPDAQMPADKPLVIGPFCFRSRLFTGTGKYATY